VWIGNTEVWRTCTAEPVWSGIHFSFSKDVSAFKSLLSSAQSLVVDIGNYVIGPYNGTFNATLSIDFYRIESPHSEPPPGHIIPLSKRDSRGVSTYFSLPDDKSAASVVIPRNSSRIVLEIFASGNGQEEFWYSNVPEEYVDTFAAWNITFLGQGPFRELIVFIDDYPIGVLWPFEVVFTGGICPGFWRPIVGHRTFDLPSYSLDLTPFISYLRGGRHEIRFEVQGQPHTLQNWYVSGHLRVWSSGPSSLPASASSSPPQSISKKANITVTGNTTNDNTSFTVTTRANRHGQPFILDYENRQTYQGLNNGSTILQSVLQKTSFQTPLSSGHFIFDLEMQESDNPDGTISINANLSQTFHRSTIMFDGSLIIEHAEVSSSGRLLIGKKRNYSQGNTSVLVNYTSAYREFLRDVRAIGFDIVSDYQEDTLVGSSAGTDSLRFQVLNV